MNLRIVSLSAALAALALPLAAGEFKVNLATDKRGAIYQKGEEIVYTIDVTEDGKPATEGKINCRVIGRHGADYARQSFPLDGTTHKITVRGEAPGWMMLEVRPVDAEGKPVVLDPKANQWDRSVQRIGAMVDPLEIKVAVPEPADFDAFWKAQREALNQVPVKATETEVEVTGSQRGRFLCYDVQVDCAGGMPVSGYLAIPANAEPKSLPALVTYHGAGVRSANKPFRSGAIAFDVNAHGIPNGKPADFYTKLTDEELKGYAHRGRESRDTFYFKGMFLRVMRALDYIKTRPEWDGKTLIVRGSSQGGGQALVAAALDPRVTFCAADVPALGDHNAMAAGRVPGWPRLLLAQGLNDEQKKKISEMAGYFDYVNFCKRINCETWVSAGFIDTTCSPSSVYAGYNNIPAAKKLIVTSPVQGHKSFNIGAERIEEIINGK